MDRRGRGRDRNTTGDWPLAARRRESGERKEGRHPEVEEVSDDSCIAELHLTKDSFSLRRCSTVSFRCRQSRSNYNTGKVENGSTVLVTKIKVI